MLRKLEVWDFWKPLYDMSSSFWHDHRKVKPRLHTGRDKSWWRNRPSFVVFGTNVLSLSFCKVLIICQLDSEDTFAFPRTSTRWFLQVRTPLESRMTFCMLTTKFSDSATCKYKEIFLNLHWSINSYVLQTSKLRTITIRFFFDYLYDRYGDARSSNWSRARRCRSSVDRSGWSTFSTCTSSVRRASSAPTRCSRPPQRRCSPPLRPRRSPPAANHPRSAPNSTRCVNKFLRTRKHLPQIQFQTEEYLTTIKASSEGQKCSYCCLTKFVWVTCSRDASARGGVGVASFSDRCSASLHTTPPLHDLIVEATKWTKRRRMLARDSAGAESAEWGNTWLEMSSPKRGRDFHGCQQSSSIPLLHRQEISQCQNLRQLSQNSRFWTRSSLQIYPFTGLEPTPFEQHARLFRSIWSHNKGTRPQRTVLRRPVVTPRLLGLHWNFHLWRVKGVCVLGVVFGHLGLCSSNKAGRDASTDAPTLWQTGASVSKNCFGTLNSSVFWSGVDAWGSSRFIIWVFVNVTSYDAHVSSHNDLPGRQDPSREGM